jgi:transcriptional regulator with XRE-family HTH domain
MLVPIHEQLRTARLAHGFSQQKLADLADLDRSDIQRLERGDNVGIRTIEKVLAHLPELKKVSVGNVDVVVDTITLDVDALRQLTLDMVSTGTKILNLLEQARKPAAQEGPGPVGATRVVPVNDVNPTLKERLRRLDPTDLGPSPPDPKDHS